MMDDFDHLIFKHPYALDHSPTFWLCEISAWHDFYLQLFRMDSLDGCFYYQISLLGVIPVPLHGVIQPL